MPKISVVVPVYNAERHLKKCIDSILAQTFRDFEIILVDDGSSDSSPVICDEYAKANDCIAVIHKPNEGVSQARNDGVAKAKGEYLAFSDSDDTVEPDWLEEMFRLIQKESADLAFCNYKGVSQTGAQEFAHGFAEGTVLEGKQLRETIYSNIAKGDSVGYFSLWNKLFKTQIIRENQILFDREMSFGEDMLFIMAYLKHTGRMVLSEKALYNYQMSETGLFASYKPSFLCDILKCYRCMIADTAGYGDSIRLDFKYYFYLERYIRDVVRCEKNKKQKFNALFQNETVCKIYQNIVNDQSESHSQLSEYELQIPRLVAAGNWKKATKKALYIYDETHFLRRLKKWFENTKAAFTLKCRKK